MYWFHFTVWYIVFCFWRVYSNLWCVRLWIHARPNYSIRLSTCKTHLRSKLVLSMIKLCGILALLVFFLQLFVYLLVHMKMIWLCFLCQKLIVILLEIKSNNLEDFAFSGTIYFQGLKLVFFSMQSYILFNRKQ
jgi:hypothetical protein